MYVCVWVRLWYVTEGVIHATEMSVFSVQEMAASSFVGLLLCLVLLSISIVYCLIAPLLFVFRVLYCIFFANIPDLFIVFEQLRGLRLNIGVSRCSHVISFVKKVARFFEIIRDCYTLRTKD